MTDHPITPPPELVASMIMQTFGPLGPTGLADKEELAKAFASFSAMAAEWGADQELEACSEWLDREGWPGFSRRLRATRRPKPPSLAEQALKTLEDAPGPDSFWAVTVLNAEQHALIRRALEALPDD